MSNAEQIETLAAEIETLGALKLAKNCRLVADYLDHPSAAHRMWVVCAAINERVHFAPVTQPKFLPLIAKASRIAEALEA